MTYLEILKKLRQSALKMGLNTFIFQHDRDPKHTAKVITKYLNNKDINILDQPSQSPDLNPIEHIWAYMKIQLRCKIYKTKDELKVELLDLMNNIPAQLINRLIKSVPKRII